MLLRKSELALRHCLHHLVRLLGQALRHSLRFFSVESLQLIEERHLFDLFLRIFFDLGFFPRDLRLVNLAFAFHGQVRAGAHRQRRRQHSRETRDQDVMLLIVRRTRDAGDNSEYGAESIVHSINCVRHPTATAPMPAFAFQNGVEHRARAELRHHCLKRARVRFFFDRAFAQKILHVMFAGKNALTLIAKRGFVFFFRRLHPANCNLGPKRAIQPALQAPA